MKLPYAGGVVLATVLLVVLGTGLSAISIPPAGVRAAGSDANPTLLASSEVLPSGYNSSPVVGVLATTDVGFAPTYLSEDSANGWVYSSNQAANTVSVLDGSALLGSVPVGQDPRGMAFATASGTVFVANEQSDSVTVINGTDAIADISVGAAPVSPVYDASDGYVYVLNSQSQSVSILNDTSVVATLGVGEVPVSAVYDPVNGYVYVTCQASIFVSVLSGTTVVGAVDVDLTLPFDTLYDAENGLVYVLNQTVQAPKVCGPASCTWTLGQARASVISGMTVIDSLQIGGGPGYATIDAANGWLYVPDGGTNQVTVVNGTTLVGEVPVGALPEDSEYDPGNGFVYVPDELSDQVSVIDGTTLIEDLTVGTYPSASIFDGTNGQVYVANLGASTVSVLGTVVGWAVRFTETGLAPGTPWSVTAEGVTRGSTTSTILFYEPNGTYWYTVGPVPGYNTTSAGLGQGVETGGGTQIPVAFEATNPPSPAAPFPAVAVASGIIGVVAVALIAWAVIAVWRRRRDRVLRLTEGGRVGLPTSLPRRARPGSAT